jgi:hypothetical protein
LLLRIKDPAQIKESNVWGLLRDTVDDDVRNFVPENVSFPVDVVLGDTVDVKG